MKNFRFLQDYLHYLFFAKTKFDIHSPFVYDYVTHVLEDERHFYAFDEISNLREQLLLTKKSVSITDLGAGGMANPLKHRSIGDIVREAAIPEKWGKLLFRTIHYFKPEITIELGTSLGLGTLYISMANTAGNIYTIEGAGSLADIAMENFNNLRVGDPDCSTGQVIQLIKGDFDERLPDLLHSLEKIDFVYFDGNHRYEPTMRYFEMCAEKSHDHTFFIFDDIRWSAEMYRAWKKIKSDSRISVTLDLYRWGIVFFRKGQKKQDFLIYF